MKLNLVLLIIVFNAALVSVPVLPGLSVPGASNETKKVETATESSAVNSSLDSIAGDVLKIVSQF
jgi:hypothetical protein